MKHHNSLVYYKRHNASCPHAADPAHMGCDCIIWIKGRTPAGTSVPRQTTGETMLIPAQRFGTSLSTKAIREVTDQKVHGYNLPDAFEAFFDAQSGSIKASTGTMYANRLNHFAAFCSTKGVSYMRELTVDLVETYCNRYVMKASGKPMKDGSKHHAAVMMKCFLNFAYRRDMLTSDIPRKMQFKKIPHEPKEPFTDDEIRLILDSINASGIYGGYSRDHETFRLLLEFMLDTGMRVGDALLFEPEKVKAGRISPSYSFYPQKRKTTEEKRLITVFPSPDLLERIKRVHWNTPTMPFFPIERRSGKPVLHKSRVWRTMQEHGDTIGVADCRPHRLRDTFAVRLLRAGATLDEVSKLLGHTTVGMTEKYYARWTVERENRLESRLASLRQMPEHGTLRNS